MAEPTLTPSNSTSDDGLADSAIERDQVQVRRDVDECLAPVLRLGAEKGLVHVLSLPRAWRLARMHEIVTHHRDVAYALSCLSLYDQLELSLELLLAAECWFNEQPPEPPCSNIIRFPLQRVR